MLPEYGAEIFEAERLREMRRSGHNQSLKRLRMAAQK
jgi:hypothetical protein